VVPQDYAFHGQGPDGGVTEMRLSELFAPGRDSLVIYSMMFPRDSEDDRPGRAGDGLGAGSAGQVEHGSASLVASCTALLGWVARGGHAICLAFRCLAWCGLKSRAVPVPVAGR
jgi:predicted dithiol-disulfide oxidoreductase (DUF899 family)